MAALNLHDTQQQLLHSSFSTHLDPITEALLEVISDPIGPAVPLTEQ
jgi:hypothetical protein